MNTYRVEYANAEIFNIIYADNNKEAIKEAFETETEETGNIFNVILLDDDYNEIETIL